jgi:RHS repeat-associated protein
LDNNDYVNGLGFCCNPGGESVSGGGSSNPTGKLMAGKNDNAELQQFYYHPDHLGSSSYITNLDGEVVQHVEYVPFGEVFLEEKNAKWNTPYLFTSKELDRETGLYYFGARYQDPKLGIFISVDPLAEKFVGYSSYNYAFNNPIRFTDPTGMGPDDIIKIKNDGSIERKKTKDNFDIITNEKGNKSIKINHKDGKSQIGEIQEQKLSGERTIQYMLIGDNKVARKVFEFAASTTTKETSEVEFGLDMFEFNDGFSMNIFQTGEINPKGVPNVISLGQLGGIDLGNNHFIKDSNWIENNHSHPGNFTPLTPSGFLRRFESGVPIFEAVGDGDRTPMRRAEPNKKYVYGLDGKTFNYIEYNFESAKIIGNRK